MLPRIVTRAVTQFPSEGIAPTGKRVEVRAIDMFRIREGKIVEHWGHADDPTGFLRAAECS